MLKADITLVTLSVYITHHLYTIQLHTASPSYMHSIPDSMCVQQPTCLDTSVFASVSFTLLAQIRPRSFSKSNVNVL